MYPYGGTSADISKITTILEGNRYLLSPVKATNIKKLGIDPNMIFPSGTKFDQNKQFFGRIKDNGDRHYIPTVILVYARGLDNT